MERNEEDWSVECSDDEKYEADSKVRSVINVIFAGIVAGIDASVFSLIMLIYLYRVNGFLSQKT